MPHPQTNARVMLLHVPLREFIGTFWGCAWDPDERSYVSLTDVLSAVIFFRLTMTSAPCLPELSLLARSFQPETRLYCQLEPYFCQTSLALALSPSKTSEVCTPNACNPRFWVPNTFIKGHIPWFRDPNPRVQTLRVRVQGALGPCPPAGCRRADQSASQALDQSLPLHA